ncbi:MAG: hypothetical protein J1G38_04030 [Clostridiales bacterium]|nr:hypothetical protein [Clostridiales bacterium]
MKKIKSFIYVTLAVLSLSLLGAWMPTNVVSVEERYADVQVYSRYATETIDFDEKKTDANINSAPMYTAVSGLTNACGAVAGTEVVAYYDKYYPDMIPDWESFYAASGKYRPQDKVYIPSVMTELYTLMHTNIGGDGVSDSDFVNGLTQYINGRGYGVSMQNVVSGSSIDFAACKTAIDNSKVIALLSRATDVYILSEGATQDVIVPSTISGLHIMIARGYQENKYYKNGTLFRTDRYLIVSTGLQGIGTACYKLNNHKLNYAYIVNIV